MCQPFCTRLAVWVGISRVCNTADFLCMHAILCPGGHFACTQCCRRGLHACETIPGLAFRVYVMLRLFFAYMRFYTYTDISRARNSLSLFCMHAVLYPESLFACLQYILATSSAREHVSKPRFRVYVNLHGHILYTRTFLQELIPRVRKAQPQTANKNHIYNMSKKIDLLQKFEKNNRKIWIF